MLLTGEPDDVSKNFKVKLRPEDDVDYEKGRRGLWCGIHMLGCCVIRHAVLNRVVFFCGPPV